MKQYLSSEQTAKLIELGLQKPKSIIDVWAHETDIDMEYEYETAYSIGELLSFLPTSFNGDDYYALTIRGSKVMYCDPYLDWIEIDWVKHEELIDNLFDACVKLKEEGVI